MEKEFVFLNVCPDCGRNDSLTTLEECTDYPERTVLSYCTWCDCRFNILPKEEYDKFNPVLDDEN